MVNFPGEAKIAFFISTLLVPIRPCSLHVLD